MSAPSRAVILCGTEELDPEPRVLRAGALSAELAAGALRYIRFGGVEVLRAISFLIRDENWGTVTPVIAGLTVEEKADGFRVAYRGTCAYGQNRLVYDVVIAGRADGTLAFEAEMLAETDATTNRAGFVVLHPLAGVAGKPVRVVHTDGKESLDRFPDLISPSQPIFDIASLAHEVMPDVWATCAMEGDAFEMEDQRNWTDASYKTYIRPLSKPRPYVIAKGTRQRQSVRLSIAGAPRGAVAPPPNDVAVTLGGGTGSRLPAIGLGVPAEEVVHALAARDRVKALAPRHLIAQVDLRKKHGEAELAGFRELAGAVGADLVLEIILIGDKQHDPAAELRAVAGAVAKAGAKPAAVMVSPASDLMSHQPGEEDPDVQPASAIYAAARAAFPGIRLGGGMFSYFTELNRKRPPHELLDFVSHTTCPIVHAADDRSVMESLEALPSVIASTRSFIGGAAYRVGPSAIGCRANAYGKSPFPNPQGGRVCLTATDPRQRGLFNAAWTLAYVAAFARGGIEAVAMGAPTGPFGFIYRRTGDAQPWFDGLGGAPVYPAFHVMAGLARDSGSQLLDVRVADASAVGALAYRRDAKTVLWLANLTAAPKPVTLAGLPAGIARANILDEGTFAQAVTAPSAFAGLARPFVGSRMSLSPYAVASIEFDG